jgi:hypothetical protein
MAEFGALNLEEMAGEDARLHKEGGPGNFLEQFVPMPKVKPGQSGSVAVRILPPVKGGKLFQYNRTHKVNGRSVHCPRPLINNKWDRNVACPLCDYYSQLWKQIDKIEKAHGKDCPEAEPLKEEARGLKPIERYYYNAIVRSMVVDGKEQKNVGPRILSVGVILHRKIVSAIMGKEGDPDSKLGNITDLKAGWDFVIRMTVTAGSEGFPKYDDSSFSRSQSVAGTPEEIKKWQEALHDLTKLRNPKDLEYLEKELAIHRQLIPDDSEAFDTDTFDAKWKQKGGEEMEDMVQQATKKTTVRVESEVPAAKAPKQEEVVESKSIEDDAFLKELEGMGGN